MKGSYLVAVLDYFGGPASTDVRGADAPSERAEEARGSRGFARLTVPSISSRLVFLLFSSFFDFCLCPFYNISYKQSD